jgi:peptide/nickel transport system ATP-binding protein
MPSVILELDNLKKYFPISNGLFRICRLYQPDSGRIIFNDEDITHSSSHTLRDIRKNIQYIFQDPNDSLNPRHTVHTTLSEPLIIHGHAKHTHNQRIAEIMDRVGLPQTALNKFPHEFSGGQKQRIGIARALMLSPKLIICDEPVSALDVSVQSQIINLLLELQQDLGLSMIFIAHDLAVVKHVSDRVAVMYLGKLMESASATDIYQSPSHPYTQHLIKSIPRPMMGKYTYTPLPGEVPSPLNTPKGCPFVERCHLATSECHQTMPDLKPIIGNHLIACHHDQTAKQQWIPL